MYLELVTKKSDRTVKERYEELSDEQKLVLVEEAKKLKEDLKEKLIVTQTKQKSLLEEKEKLEKTLLEEYNIKSEEDIVNKIAELNGEIISALTEYSNALNANE